MVFNINDLEVSDKNNDYTTFTTDNLVCYFRGFFYSGGKRAGKESIKLLIDQYISTGTINFKEFYGAYHIIFIDKQKEQYYFFTDNEGSCCFYFNEDKGLLSDSFLELSDLIGNKTPNYAAITEFIHFNCVYSEDTICNEIVRTNALKFYSIKKNKIVCKDKSLDIWNGNLKYKNLHEFMKDLAYACNGYKTVSIITGGTDSRSLLSHRNVLEDKFDLAISGSEEKNDVKIAKKIAWKLGKNIHISDEKVNNPNKGWLRKLFLRSDGVSGVFSRYRLHKKSTMLERLGFQVEIGGIGGELYKNSFLNQDLPLYNRGKVNIDRFYNLKINPLQFSQKYFAKPVNEDLTHMKKRILRNVWDKKNGKKSKIYFRTGSRILRYRMVALTNSGSLSVPSISPLMEIDMMKLPYNKNPWKLEVNNWQRNEVSTYCPTIAKIETDRGVTLVNKKAQMVKEFISSYAFLIKVGLKRTLLKKRNLKEKKRLDVFVKGRKLQEFEMAMYKCKELNVLNKEVDINKIPDTLADRLMTIGLFFMNYQSKYSAVN